MEFKPTPAAALGYGLSGKVAVVTGAAGDIGRNTVELFVRHGVRVVAEDLRPQVHDLACAGKVVCLDGDVSDPATARTAIELAATHFGGLDIVVNNAGRTLARSVVETSVEEWDDVMRVNARGTFLHAREAIPVLASRSDAAIVNVASIVSLVGMVQTSAYAASKGAIAQLTKVLALECGPQGIRVNAVAPGVVVTGILDGIVDNGREALASWADKHPIGRVAQPGEIAEVIAYLASPRASFITGAVIAADGGYTAQ